MRVTRRGQVQRERERDVRPRREIPRQSAEFAIGRDFSLARMPLTPLKGGSTNRAVRTRAHACYFLYSRYGIFTGSVVPVVECTHHWKTLWHGHPVVRLPVACIRNGESYLQQVDPIDTDDKTY